MIGVRAGLFWARVACATSSSLLLIVCTSSCICIATRIALCVCCFLSTSFVVVWRRYLKDGTQPSQALPGHVALDVVVARGLSERWCVHDPFAIDGVRAVVRCRGHRFDSALHDSIFFKSVFFAMSVSITMSDSDRGG